jgi:Carboxypeptidase regulatory-like domain
MKYGLFLLVPCLTWAQGAGVTLSGAVTGPSGTAVAGAKVSIKSVMSGQVTEAQTNSTGQYSVPNLFAGEYQVSVSADGLNAKTVAVTISSGSTQTLDVALATSLGNAPTLGDLGFPTAAGQGSAQDQARLDRRSHMLQMHQRLGLITAIPLVATLIASGGAGGHSTSSAARDLHAALGSVTVGMYVWTASYAIRAPKIPGTPTRGPIRVHKALAWVHGTGMILTPILGAMAFDEKSKGEKVHGIASAHGAAAWVTGIAYGAAIVTVSVKF